MQCEGPRWRFAWTIVAALRASGQPGALGQVPSEENSELPFKDYLGLSAGEWRTGWSSLGQRVLRVPDAGTACVRRCWRSGVVEVILQR